MTNVAIVDGGHVMQNPLLHIWLWSRLSDVNVFCVKKKPQTLNNLESFLFWAKIFSSITFYLYRDKT